MKAEQLIQDIKREVRRRPAVLLVGVALIWLTVTVLAMVLLS